MAFNVNDFRSQMVGDGARPNLFDVTLTFPSFALAGNANQKMTFMCKTSQLPAATIGSVEVNYFGRQLKFAGNRTFADWTITIINDEDFSIRNAFERWSHGINSHISNLRLGSALRPESYTVDAIVNQYSKIGGSPIKTYKYVGIFPVEISAIDVDWGNNDSIEEFSVTLAYQWWEAVDTTESTGTFVTA